MKKKPESKATEIQTVICLKSRFKSLRDAIKWIRDHDFKVRHKGKAPDTTSTSFRFRQRDPGDFKKGTFRTIELDKGVKAVVGTPKEKEK